MADMRLFSSDSSTSSAYFELLNIATLIFSKFLDHENAFRKGPGSDARSNTTLVQHSGIPARMLCHNLQTDAALNGKSDSERRSRSIHSQVMGSKGPGIRESDKRNFRMEV